MHVTAQIGHRSCGRGRALHVNVVAARSLKLQQGRTPHSHVDVAAEVAEASEHALEWLGVGRQELLELLVPQHLHACMQETALTACTQELEPLSTQPADGTARTIGAHVPVCVYRSPIIESPQYSVGTDMAAAHIATCMLPLASTQCLNSEPVPSSTCLHLPAAQGHVVA